ncbi:MAG: hypothetical protein PHQ43_01480 [Dehalococcoidales bacterium]|nr:hypothetical protein [Dehalococcoidales bacterium]
MPIKWSALKVSEAADMVEGFLDEAVEPLECARNAAREALKLDNLPEYMSQHFTRVISEIDRAIGGSQWEPVGRIRSGLQSVRDNLPSGAVESDRARQQHGSQQMLV